MALFPGATNSTATLARTADINIVHPAIPSSSGTATGITARIWAPSGGSSSVPRFRGVIYADSAGAPGALLATGDEIIFTNTTEAEVISTLSGANQIAITRGTTYWIGIILDAGISPQDATLSRGGVANAAKFRTDTYPTPANPFGTTSTTNGPLDVYCTYTGQGNFLFM